jgi:hypothetical protein
VKIKHTIEVSALDLALILKEKLSIAGVHHSDLDLEVIGTDPGNFSSPKRPLETLKITWTEDDSSGQWSR